METKILESTCKNGFAKGIIQFSEVGSPPQGFIFDEELLPGEECDVAIHRILGMLHNHFLEREKG